VYLADIINIIATTVNRLNLFCFIMIG